MLEKCFYEQTEYIAGIRSNIVDILKKIVGFEDDSKIPEMPTNLVSKEEWELDILKNILSLTERLEEII